MPRLVLVLLVVLIALLAPPGAGASRRFWATINQCRPASAPDAMGVRASMAGTGRLRRMYMRFRAQYILPAARRWRWVRGGRSPWIDLGRSRTRRVQAGWTFTFDKPAPGGSFSARGLVEFQWRSKRRRRPERVTKRRRAVTRTGIRGVDGGDPPRTSLTSCLFA